MSRTADSSTACRCELFLGTVFLTIGLMLAAAGVAIR